MVSLLIRWIISAVLLLVVSHVVPGFRVASFTAALVAALVIGLINATLGVILKVLTFPLTIVTFGIFLIVINAVLLIFASNFVRGFSVNSFSSAFIAALLLSVLNMLARWMTPSHN